MRNEGRLSNAFANKRGACQSPTFDDALIRIGKRKFEHILGEVDRDGRSGGGFGRSMHGGLLS
jgi:hypothetical protein